MLVFYSGRDYIILPDVSPEELHGLAKKEGARFVVLDGTCVRKKKALGPLLDPWVKGFASEVAGFRPVYLNAETDVVIYEAEGVI